MSLTEREKEIALSLGLPLDKSEAFLSGIRKEQEGYWAYRVYDPHIDRVSYDHTSDKGEAFEADAFAFKIFTTPPAAPECNCEELMKALWRIKKHDTRDCINATFCSLSDKSFA